LATGGKNLTSFKKPNISYWVREPQVEFLNKLLDPIYVHFPKERFEVDGTISKVINIPFGEACNLCAKVLNDQTPQYYSPFTKVHYCTDCAEADDTTQKGLKRYKVQDTVIFINAPLKDTSVLENIDEYKIGKNLKIKDDEEGTQKHPMGCNGRAACKDGPRYIAINCRPGKLRGDGYVDFC